MRMTTVPSRDSDLVRRGYANGFALTEAWSPAGLIPMHAHPMLSVTVLLEGAFEEHYLPIHKTQECQAGSLLVRPAGEAHANRLGRSGGRTLSIEFDTERLKASGLDAMLSLPLAHQREGVFLDLGLAMSHELHQKDSASRITIESLCLELLARLLRLRQPASTGATQPWLNQVREMIHARFRSEKLRIADLAAEAGVHAVHLARVFRRNYGVTPGEYIRRLRLELARERMRSGESLAAVALECGFSDQSHFARAFRARYGITPGRVRRG